MYLKEIKTSGFKSFADKITIALDGKTTCIVGPNGSGKSNIVDAVRWVLGEQSVKTLRGDGSMSEVIFQGSKSRAPLNTAYVELVFQNEDHYLNIPYTEVSLKRKVFRTGENEYFINNERCRLKDIVDLLLDSGVGRSSFNIIGQGEVQKILSNQSEDRRQIFEEAAGILKYKKRKAEALKKLEKTHFSMERVEDILKELERQLTPLKEQSEKARSYQDAKENLEQNEISLIAYDLTRYQEQLETNKKEQTRLQEEIAAQDAKKVLLESDRMKEKARLIKLEKNVSVFQEDLLTKTEEVVQLKGELNLLKASDTSSMEEDALKEKMRKKLEEEKDLEKQIQLLKTEIALLKEQQTIFLKEEKEKKEALQAEKKKTQNKEAELSQCMKTILKEQYKVEAIGRELEQGGFIPEAVRFLLQASHVKGIHDTIGNVVSMDSKYLKAFDVIAASSKNFLIVEDEQAGKDAISYLKQHEKGRATFFPISVIESRLLDQSMQENLAKGATFLGILSQFIHCDKKYQNIIENQFGNVLVAKDLDDATILSKKTGHRFRIVSLDGDVIHTGGSMSGGASFKGKSIPSMKEELRKHEMQLAFEKTTKNRLQKEIASSFETIQQMEEKLRNVLFEKEQALALILQKEKQLKEKNEQKRYEQTALKSYQSRMEGSLQEEEKKLIEDVSKKNTDKEELELKIAKEKEAISLCQEKIMEEEAQGKVLEKAQKEMEQEVQNIVLSSNRITFKMDTLLETLREDYSMTYEKAKEKYPLLQEENDVRNQVLFYKEKLKQIGMVNLEAIEEYEQVKTRYDFLISQKEDLTKAENTLLEIMREMDAVMEEEFLKTFEAIRCEFQKVFKELFHGGTADLKLTNQEDLLTTGIDILASPPGKKLSTITLLSGGEKTLTAISLLFAILNVRTVPFCLFDEVEAALDEANVEQFGKYLEHYKNKTQFLIITHKKKTMEYADTLYGITMQESGVSKLVSVKLQEQEEQL